MFDSFVDPILSPILNINLFLAISIISLLMSVLITLAYKYLTDQNLMKDLKTEIKSFQKQMKELRSNPEKMMKVQKKAMETNMKYMMHSMKPTLITFLPIIIIFGWLNSHLAYSPILPDQQFTTTSDMAKGISGVIEITLPDGIVLISESQQTIVNNQASWALKGEEGVYILQYDYNNETQEKELTISGDKEYSSVEKRIKDKASAFKKIKINNEKTKPLGDLSIFSWTPGWLATYIILSIIFSMGLRKVMKIY